MDLKSHWKSIRYEAAKLDPESAAADAEEMYQADKTHLDKSQKEIWLISLDNPSVASAGGQVVSAHPMNAARMIFDRTHELARPEHIREHKAELERRKEAEDRDQAEKKGISTNRLLEAFIAAQQGRPFKQQPVTKH